MRETLRFEALCRYRVMTDVINRRHCSHGEPHRALGTSPCQEFNATAGAHASLAARGIIRRSAAPGLDAMSPARKPKRIHP